ncbi:hypothetical protein NMG60_11027499 [Bertholletia excelsa]
MEFLDEETRPRFVFQSRSQPSTRPEPQTPNLHKPSLLISLSLSTLLLALSLFFLQIEPFRSLLFWFALSLLLGPFAPSTLTGGDIRVGVGQILETPPQNDDIDREDPKKKTSNRRSQARKPDDTGYNPTPAVVYQPEKGKNRDDKSTSKEGEREWSEGDFELLKKLLVKHPVGKPRRWEAISEGFQGRHGVESVIKMAKSMGEKKSSDADSFARFLKDRKPVDKRVEGGIEGAGGDPDGGGEGDDIALLNALKAFPKDVPMRWEKIAAAVPGKSKAACMKRVAELKRDFRSSKSSAES